MDMLHPVSAPAYSKHNQSLAAASMGVVLGNMHAASAHLYSLCGAEPTNILNCAVTCDGTWSKCASQELMEWWLSSPGRVGKYLILRL